LRRAFKIALVLLRMNTIHWASPRGDRARTKGFEVIENYPETVALFRQFGSSLIDNPMAQRIFARSVSLERPAASDTSILRPFKPPSTSWSGKVVEAGTT